MTFWKHISTSSMIAIFTGISWAISSTLFLPFSTSRSANGKIIDLVLKFAPNQQIFLHSHLALTNTFVVQGEHRLYEPSGALKEVRPVGSYTSTPPGEPHREGGGEEGGVVLYSIRGGGDVLFEILDDSLKVIGTLTRQNFIDAYKEQRGRTSK